MKSNGIKKIFILDEDKNFFSRSENYEIPIYQRPYAWEEKQLCQLVDDIISFDENEYCIGSLIVYSKANLHEVIDGQQRLTSLYLLLNCLKINTDSTVSYPNRERSNYIIENIQNFVDNTYDDEQEKHAQAEILKGLNILKKILPRQNNERETFIEKLKKVYLYQIEVPQYTDLNHYFEIMNTRGEQLEQQDVLKANLMDYLIDEEDKASFACIWDACSDMNGYVQMHFSPKNRELLFGTGWNSKPTLSWRTFKKIHSDYSEKKSFDIQHIINQEFDIMKENEIDDDDNNVKFESIIDFPHFLIHAVKVFVNLYCDNKNEKITDELLDDKKLLKTFNDVIAKGVVDSKKIGYNRDGKSNFSQKFLMLLLKLRFVFDQYIIKRVYVENDPVGKWSLQSLAVSNKKAYYKNTSLALWREWEKTYGPRNKACLMLQSALRVSYTSPKNMHWITSLLSWLSSRGFENKLDQYCSVVEKIAIQTVKEDFLNQGEMGFDLGVDTPHIVFNYLDFLLWRKDQGNKRHKYDDFTFEFRNSVEHFYPQHPSDRSLDEWSHKDGLDYFGNLCLLPSSINSKFSNLAPKSKVDTYSKEFEKGSIKLRKMGSLVKNHDNVEWKKSICRRHGEEMINLLKEACEGF
mgnify:CR=1 FL=1